MRRIDGDAKSIRSMLGGSKFAIDYYQREYRCTALLQKSDSIPNALPPDRLGDGQKRLHLPL